MRERFEGKMYFTVAGINYRYGKDVFEKGTIVKLVKEPDNEYDKEAIKVEMEALDIVGYVANSTRTVRGNSFSAGRLYDKIDDVAYGEVIHILPDSVVCKVVEPINAGF